MRSRLDNALILLFAAALCAPALDAWMRPQARRDVEVEARLPEPLPALPVTFEAARAVPRGIERWWGDALGFRDVLLRCGSRMRFQVFRVAPGEPVLVGRDDWIFPTLLGIVDASRGRARLTRARLEAWRKALESRRAFCRELGAEYCVAFAPEKGSIYPERLPEPWRPIGPGVQDQFVGWLEEHSDLRAIDLRPALLEAKARDQGADFAYYPLGTHWTDRGGLAVERVLVEALRARVPGLAPVEDAEPVWELDPEQGDSWAQRLRLAGILRQEARVDPRMQREFDGRVERDGHVARMTNGDGGGPSLLVFHDSFGDRVQKLLARRFGRSTFVGSPRFDPAIVRDARPSVVLELFAERRLLLDLPAALAEGTHAGLARELDASTETHFVLELPRDAARVRGVDGTRATLEGAALVVERGTGSAGLVEIEVPPFPSGRACLVRVEIESPRADKLDVLYRTRGQPRFHRGQVASVRTPAGRAVVHLEIGDLELEGPLRLRAGVESARHVLHGFELRIAPR